MVPVETLVRRRAQPLISILQKAKKKNLSFSDSVT